MRAQVVEVIELMRPALRADGGDIELDDVDEATGVVTVRLEGAACYGCATTTPNLEAGVGRILRDRVPGITEIRCLDACGPDAADCAHHGHQPG